jgi:hypothetical protein
MGSKRFGKLCIKVTAQRSMISAIAPQSVSVWAMGFSHRIALPLFAAASIKEGCRAVAEQMATASLASRSSSIVANCLI